MTPAQLLAACQRLDGPHGRGGRTRLARLLGWNYTTLWRKLRGEHEIYPDDVLAVRQALKDAGCSADS